MPNRNELLINWLPAANSILEMHTFLVALVGQFDFSPPDNGQQIRAMRPAGVISPVVIGEEHKGPQMPLKVTALRNE